jgi:hypothetical protein
MAKEIGFRDIEKINKDVLRRTGSFGETKRKAPPHRNGEGLLKQ